MKKFLEYVAEKIVAKHGANLSRVLVLMPNQRSSTYFRNTLKQMAKQAIIAPEIQALQNFMLGKSELIVADSIELVAELYNCHKAIGGELTLDDFIGTANVMLDDFDQIDMQMADAQLFFKNLELLQSMKTYEPGEEPDEYKLKYRKFWEEFGLLYDMLRKNLFAKQKGYRGMILRHAAEHLKDFPLDGIDAVYLIGFNSLNKVDEALVEHLRQKRNAEMMWDADKYYVNDEVNEAGHFIRRYRTRFQIETKELVDEIGTVPKKIQVIGAAKSIGQVKVAADILQNKLDVNEITALDTVVVVPDEKLLGPLMANLPANIAAVNITMGLNIAGSNAATFLEIIFRLYENSRRYQSATSGQRFYYKDVFELLQHNFFRLLFGEKHVDVFIERMKSLNRILIRRDELIAQFGDDIYSILFEGEAAKDYSAYLLSIADNLLDKLIQLVRAGNGTLAPEAEIAFRLRGILQNAEGIFALGDSVGIKTFINLLRQNFRNERVPLEGDPVQGLQIMGLLETRALDFKNVIILSANEGILPSGKFVNSYIPFELQREFLTTYKERDANNAYLFYRLFQKAENVFILYNTEADELGGGEKSRFILQLEHELRLKNKNAEIQDLVFAVDPPPVVGEQEINIVKKDEVLGKINEILTTSGLSPSALNTYINCTLQYYFRYIAGIQQQEDMEENLEASTIGSAVHYALQMIYTDRLGKAVDADFIKTQLNNKQRIEHLVREELSKRFDNESLSRGKNLLLYKVCVKLVEEFLKHELDNLEQLGDSGASMQIEMLEGKLAHEFDLGGRQVKVSGRVDRIERVGGVIQIADYKTSGRSTIPVLNDETWQMLVNDPKYAKTVQLLVYAWLYFRNNGGKETPIRSGIYWLRESQKRLDTLRVNKENDVIDTATLLKFEEMLKMVLMELLDEDVQFKKTEDVKRCVYCEFIKICGRD